MHWAIKHYEEVRGSGLPEDAKPEQLAITVRNVGRLPASITSVWVVSEEGSVGIGDPPSGKEFPYLLEAQHEMDWEYDLGLAIRLMLSAQERLEQANMVPRQDTSRIQNLWMEVQLGTGERIRTKEKYRLS